MLREIYVYTKTFLKVIYNIYSFIRLFNFYIGNNDHKNNIDINLKRKKIIHFLMLQLIILHWILFLKVDLSSEIF